MRICADCGGAFAERTGKGHPFSRCEKCRAKPRKRSQAKRIRESVCTDCDRAFTVERTAQSKKLRGPTRCEDCRKAKRREIMRNWREANPEKVKAGSDRGNAKRLADPEYLRRKREAAGVRLYGVTQEEYDRVFAEQDGKCAICRKPPSGRPNGKARDVLEPCLHKDHDHVTKRFRGLLCGNCNTALGLFGDDVDTLLAAVAYLKE